MHGIPNTRRITHEEKKQRRRLRQIERQKGQRTQFIIKFLDDDTDWKKIVWTDEKKFRLDGPDKYNSVWVDVDREQPEDVLSVDYQHYNGVMVWMAISSKNVLHFCRVNGAINCDDYWDIVTGEDLAAMHYVHGENFTYQQDNATPHVRKDILSGFQDLNLNVMSWPACSPDLSMIENVWSLLATRVYKEIPTFGNENLMWRKNAKEIRALKTKDTVPYVQSIGSRLIT
ncbi:MAG: putative Transposable element Tc3 transposase [Streblomastix strix]|uniref:Putative Transposable element Tc3 transposase n=1 Tax=Streblomastix strix TaxID=222440 RepID=A0A5J4VW38_9EUKA|nr:MAG: putative Transposable element Tc3 transposase [Streblomastix strix]